MCTAICYQTKGFYFGRTLDYDCSYAEQVTVTPRRFPLQFRHTAPLARHYALIGMASVKGGYPLYYDAVNEKGLAVAGLNFTEYACYGKPQPGRVNVAQFELPLWLLAQCATVAQAKALMRQLNITDTPFSAGLPAAQLHWMLADRTEALVIESVSDGLRLHSNPVGVLTNNPPFEQQLMRLNDYMTLSPCEPKNTFAPALPLRPYSRGMGAMGLPGDFSSPSRFVRAAFAKQNSVSAAGETESVTQVFHILETVAQPNGCCRTENGALEKTIYTSCCSADKGIYYYTTYENRQITAVHLHREPLDSAALICYPLQHTQQIFAHSG